jgi:hypothetical protein
MDRRVRRMTTIVTASNTLYKVDAGSIIMHSVRNGVPCVTFREGRRLITVGPVKAICD